jgi:dTDP-4-dehydrorhamnose reductase
MNNTSPPQYLILGSSGFLGSHFARRLGADAISHTSTNRDSDQNHLAFRFRNPEELRKFLREVNCKTIINCVAIADIDLCESAPELAKWVNTDIPRILSEICQSTGKKLIHFSTDAVFDGKKSFVPESASPNPLSNYGKTKLAGELFVIKNSSNSQVFRVNFFGISPAGRSLYDFFRKAAENEIEVSGYSNLFFTPLYVEHLVNLVLENHKILDSGTDLNKKLIF